jgi:hypothetical protein
VCYTKGDQNIVARAYFSDKSGENQAKDQKKEVVLEIVPIKIVNPKSEIPSKELNLENAILEETFFEKNCLREKVKHHLFSKYGLFDKDFRYR